MQNNRIISNVLDWLTHPMYSDESVTFWFAALLGLLVLSFLWSMVIKQLES
jgi:hypothetical protein